MKTFNLQYITSKFKTFLATALVATLVSLVFFQPAGAESCSDGTDVPAPLPAPITSAEQFCESHGGIDDGDLDARPDTSTFGGNRVDCQDDSGFFGFPTWYKYLPTEQGPDGGCDVVLVKNGADTNIGATAGAIGLAIFEIILRFIGIAAVGLVIWGGFQYVLSQGEPDKVKGARTTIINALVGAFIAMFAVAAVNLLGGSFAAGPASGGFGLPGAPTTEGSVATAIRLVLGLAGAIAVIMTVIGGLKYVTSQGNPQETSKAKNTIMYALIGLVIIIFAQFIVGFVLTNV